MAPKTFQNFRFADKEKTIAVCGVEPLFDPDFIEKLKKENFFVIPMWPPAPEVVERAGLAYAKNWRDYIQAFFGGKTSRVHARFEEIETRINAGKKVLITCKKGLDASPAIAAGYLAVKKGLDPQETLKRIRVQSAMPIHKQIIPSLQYIEAYNLHEKRMEKRHWRFFRDMRRKWKYRKWFRGV
jgi:hypothetical protein